MLSTHARICQAGLKIARSSTFAVTTRNTHPQSSIFHPRFMTMHAPAFAADCVAMCKFRAVQHMLRMRNLRQRSQQCPAPQWQLYLQAQPQPRPPFRRFQYSPGSHIAAYTTPSAQPTLIRTAMAVVATQAPTSTQIPLSSDWVEPTNVYEGERFTYLAGGTPIVEVIQISTSTLTEYVAPTPKMRRHAHFHNHRRRHIG